MFKAHVLLYNSRHESDKEEEEDVPAYRIVRCARVACSLSSFTHTHLTQQPHEAIHANRFITQLLDYADKHAKSGCQQPAQGVVT